MKLLVAGLIFLASITVPAASASSPVPLVDPYVGGINPNYVVGELLGGTLCDHTSLSLALRDQMTIIPADKCVNNTYIG